MSIIDSKGKEYADVIVCILVADEVDECEDYLVLSFHDIYTNGTQREEIPRHPDVNEQTAKDIIKRVKKNPGRK